MAKREAPPTDHDRAPLDDALRMRIAERAYEISQSDEAGTDEENWIRAERELNPSSRNE